MKIEAVDFFYLAMPEVTTEADGSQDALLVRVAAGGHHVGGASARRRRCVDRGFRLSDVARRMPPVGASVLGETLESPDDIARIAAEVDI